MSPKIRCASTGKKRAQTLRTLTETLLVYRVRAGLAEVQLRFRYVLHAFVADWTVVTVFEHFPLLAWVFGDLSFR